MLARDVTLTNSKYIDGTRLESGPEQKLSWYGLRRLLRSKQKCGTAFL